MTHIVKIGGKSGDTLEKNRRIIEQLKDFDGNIVAVVSANGGTTDRIVRMLDGNCEADPEEIFREFEDMYQGIETRHTMNSQLTDYRDVVYKWLRRPPMDPAVIHMSGEILAGALFDSLLDESGIESRFIHPLYDEDFPLLVTREDLNARIHYDASRKAASAVREKKITVLPGYGGIDRTARAGRMKVLGRGGSDTAAIGYMYAFKADSLWMLTDVNGILKWGEKKDESRHEPSLTVPCLDLDETVDAAILRAKLPGRKAVEGAERYFREGATPFIAVANSQDIRGPATRIVRAEEGRIPVKLVAGGGILFYELEGNLQGLDTALLRRGLDVNLSTDGSYARLIVYDSGNARTSVEEVVQRRRLAHLNPAETGAYSWVGAVGNGMRGNGRAATGISARATRALGGVNIVYNMDPGKVSLGYIVHRDDSRRAQEALYNEFLLK